jgi:hypothetical protein
MSHVAPTLLRDLRFGWAAPAGLVVIPIRDGTYVVEYLARAGTGVPVGSLGGTVMLFRFQKSP